MNMLKKKLDKMNRSQLRYICMRVFEQIDFTKLKTEKDMVNFLLKPLENKYKMILRDDKQKPLQQFTKMIINKDSDQIEYTFTEDDKEYKINVFENHGTTVHAILDIDMTKSIDIVQLEYIKNKNQIKINYVSLQTVGCTRSVAYTMKALLNYIEHKHYIIYGNVIYGNVRIKSEKNIKSEENPVKAFNCYNRAFQLNGFALDKGEFERFNEAYLAQTEGTEVDFTFSKFKKIVQVERSHWRPFWKGRSETHK